MGYQFGRDVDISGDRIIVGKYVNLYSESVPSQGYIYERRGTTWTLVAKLFDPENNSFKESVRISGDIAVAAASDGAYGRPTFIYELPAPGTLPAASAEE